MMYKAKAAVCSEIRTKHSTQSEHHELWYVKKLLCFKRLNNINQFFLRMEVNCVLCEVQTKNLIRVVINLSGHYRCRVCGQPVA
jgi:hypothetical protein